MIALRKFQDDRSGATAIEYALIAALIGMVVLGAAALLGGRVNAAFEGFASQVATPTP